MTTCRLLVYCGSLCTSVAVALCVSVWLVRFCDANRKEHNHWGGCDQCDSKTDYCKAIALDIDRKAKAYSGEQVMEKGMRLWVRQAMQDAKAVGENIQRATTTRCV